MPVMSGEAQSVGEFVCDTGSWTIQGCYGESLWEEDKEVSFIKVEASLLGLKMGWRGTRLIHFWLKKVVSGGAAKRIR